MKFFFPDSQDLVDPAFDFESERRASDRIRQRSEEYAHEALSLRAYDGMLVSKGFVDAYGGSSRMSIAQRQRLLRVGVHEFYRTQAATWGKLLMMGDCGAFAYVREKTPPYSVEEVLSFYTECKFDFGLSVDHVILSYQPSWDAEPQNVPKDVLERQQITIELASEFLSKHERDALHFHPIGVAQGWSPKSYVHAVEVLQKMGYDYIALGGMVGLKSPEILACLSAISNVRNSATRLHLLGITRVDHLTQFAKLGVASFDSTSPLRKAFKDDKDNYYTMDKAYTAIRVPQVEGNRSLGQKIKAGEIQQARARKLEKQCLETLRRFDAEACSIEEVVSCLREYEMLYDPTHDHSAVYMEVLRDRPWKHCPCDICKSLGHHVILFRGAERNRRRGFHNVGVFYHRLHKELGLET